MKLYAVRDAAINTYGLPFCAVNDREAIRGFTRAVRDFSNPNSHMATSPEDYELFHIGEFNQETGRVVANEMPRSVTTGKECKEETK